MHDRVADHLIWVYWFDRDVRSVERLEANRIADNVSAMLQASPARD